MVAGGQLQLIDPPGSGILLHRPFLKQKGSLLRVAGVLIS